MSDKVNILWISLCSPYESVDHAGGQTLNYYISRFENDEHFKVRLVTFCAPNEIDKLLYTNRTCEIDEIVLPEGIKRLIGNILSINSKFNPWYRYGNGLPWKLARLLFQKLRQIKNEGYYPDVVITEWTEITLYINRVKDLFPTSYYVACQHDVTYMRKKIEANDERRQICRVYKQSGAVNAKRLEVNALNRCDIVWVQNRNDTRVLQKAGVRRDKLNLLVPYYHRSKKEYKRKNNNILFWGNMRRKPNIVAARWFADNVMPLLKNYDCKFYILGVNGDETLKDIASDRIIPTGFIEEIDTWFAESLCFVAPMSLGAGIKVKCLEAMYSGIPVLTSKMGIDGIPARDGVDFIKCESAEEYVRAIKALIDGEVHITGKKVINSYFNIDKSFENYRGKLLSFCHKESTAE